MNAAARTNQLLYQTELLLALGSELGRVDGASRRDEHAMARRMALEEAALAQLELAFDALLREVTRHTPLDRRGWRDWFAASDVQVAELERLRALASREESWLAALLMQIERLHGDEGAARRSAQAGLIASAEQASLGVTLTWCLGEFKAVLPSLREGSLEW